MTTIGAMSHHSIVDLHISIRLKTMNYLYLNNPTVPPINRSFNFSRKNEKIDWRRIAALDVDRLARDLDFQILQENIEQIALCNIEAEVDYRAMDPNFIKLYKLAQLIIEYLLLCQDQITNQLFDYETIKTRSTTESEEFRREIQQLKNELNLTKKESKKRKKLIESQQKMLMSQRPPYHNCPVCGHSFLNGEYLQSHIQRRHPEFDPQRRREHDVDAEKELERLRDELKTKENELQMVKIQKAVDEEKVKDRDETIRQLRGEIHLIQTKNESLEEKYFALRSSQQAPPRSRDENLGDLLRQNQTLQAENEQLKHNLKQSEKNRKKEEKRLREDFEQEKSRLQKEIQQLNETLRNAGNNDALTQELNQYRTQYNNEKSRRKQLEKDLEVAQRELAQLRNQPPPIIDRKSPIPPPRTSTASPPPQPQPQPQPKAPPPARPVLKPADILLPQYCPALIRKMNENQRYLNPYRDRSAQEFDEELSQFPDLNIREKDTRLSNEDFPIKMRIIEQARRNMQNDLPDFERIRAELTSALDRLVRERLSSPQASVTSIRSSGQKLVTFEDESRPPASAIKRPSNPAPDSDDDDDEQTNTYLNPSQSEMESPKRSVPQTIKVIERKLTDSNEKGQKPTINAIAQGFQPSRQVLAPQDVSDEDDDDDNSITSITGTAPVKPTISHLVQKPANYLSSGEISQNTYDSQLRSLVGKVPLNNPPVESDDENDDDRFD